MKKLIDSVLKETHNSFIGKHNVFFIVEYAVVSKMKYIILDRKTVFYLYKQTLF